MTRFHAWANHLPPACHDLVADNDVIERATDQIRDMVDEFGFTMSLAKINEPTPEGTSPTQDPSM